MKSQVENRTLFTGDNLEVMRAVNSESVDLIYLDPPFNKKFVFPIGKGTDAKFGFTDIWGFGKGKDDPYLQEAELSAYSELEEVSELFAHRPPEVLPKKEAKTLIDFLDMMGRIGDESAMAYLSFMAIRLLEMKRVLKPTGSVYLHCDHTMGHSIKLLMDIVFGAKNFRNEIVWHYQAGTSPKNAFGRRHDCILSYAKGAKNLFARQGKPVANPRRYNKVDEAGRRYDVNGQGKRYYLDDGQTCDDVWTWWQEKEFQQVNSQSKERTGYPTQKPVALLERIISASSNEGDLILDPFCGCATTCIAAERLGRRWMGIDVAEEAARQVKIRLDKETEQGTLAAGERRVHHCYFSDESQRPMRTDIVQVRSRNVKHILFGLQEGSCNLCGQKHDFRHFDVDHIVPRAKGGLDFDSNLQLLCGSCNRIKGAGTMQRARERLRELGYAA